MSFLIQIEIFLVLGIMSDLFLLKFGHLGYHIMRFWILLKPSVLAVFFFFSVVGLTMADTTLLEGGGAGASSYFSPLGSLLASQWGGLITTGNL